MRVLFSVSCLRLSRRLAGLEKALLAALIGACDAVPANFSLTREIAWFLVLYIVHGPAGIPEDATPGFVEASPRLRVDEVLKTALRRSDKLLTGLADALEMPREVVHFFLAMTTLEAKRHVDAVVDRALFGLDTSVMSAETLRKTTKLLLGFAVGDEGLIREVGYDLDLLRRLSFRVHKETSEQCADGTLGEDHPVVFLARFAHRRTSCFDVKAHAGDAKSIAESKIFPRLGVVKGLFAIMARAWSGVPPLF